MCHTKKFYLSWLLRAVRDSGRLSALCRAPCRGRHAFGLSPHGKEACPALGAAPCSPAWRVTQSVRRCRAPYLQAQNNGSENLRTMPASKRLCRQRAACRENAPDKPDAGHKKRAPSSQSALSPALAGMVRPALPRRGMFSGLHLLQTGTSFRWSDSGCDWSPGFCRAASRTRLQARRRPSGWSDRRPDLQKSQTAGYR